MERIASFTVDHNKLVPGLYYSRRDGDIVTFDLRFKKPNTGDLLSNSEMHSVEHLIATLLRNSEDKEAVIYFGPMGCQTGFYFLFDNRLLSLEGAIELLKEVFTAAANFEGEMPGKSAVECGNYVNLDVDTGKAACKFYADLIAGWTVEKLHASFGPGCQLLRVMPNTPALVGAGYAALCAETTLEPADLEWAKRLFGTLGKVEVLPERLFDAVTAVTGSSPAYVFMFIEAMADAAVRLGMTRPMAIEAAAQAVFGSAKMVLDTHQHPAVLKDQVCSPAGTTIEAVQALEKGGFRSAVMEAMAACADKSQAMAK